LVILCRVDQHYIGGELSKSESPVRVRMREIKSRWEGRMDIGSVIGAAPLGLGVLIALGGILVTMSYLSE
jgi:hypothetical protein